MTTTVLTVKNGSDAEGDPVTYIFEIDTVPTFDSGKKRSSGPVIRSSGGSTSWAATNLREDQRYYWRVKAQDGRAETPWASSNFLMSGKNNAPPAPTIKNPGHGAWSSTRSPVLEANPVLDPEGDAVRYQFELYRAALNLRLVEGTSASTSFVTPIELLDATTYWWRVRALDAHNAAGDWSKPATIYVSTSAYQAPSIQVTSPATVVTPEVVQTPAGERQQVTLKWDGVDRNIEPTVALYYSSTPSDFAGSLIVDGLRQPAGAHSGSHVWDVTGLAPGAYYVYGVIHDAKGVGRAYAPGAVVIPDPARPGKVVLSKKSLTTNESGTRASFGVRLSWAPSANVSFGLSVTNPREGSVEPKTLSFTPQNWSVEQTVTVTGLDDCAPDGPSTYQVVMSKAVSLDPQYAAFPGQSLNVTNADSGDVSGTTDYPTLHTCKYTMVSERQPLLGTWEYVFAVEWTNTGVRLASVRAYLAPRSFGLMVYGDGKIELGSIGSGETVKPADTITIRTMSRLTNPDVFMRQNGIWRVVATPAP